MQYKKILMLYIKQHFGYSVYMYMFIYVITDNYIQIIHLHQQTTLHERDIYIIRSQHFIYVQ